MHSHKDHIAYFVSDIHLSPHRPELYEAFFNFISIMKKDATDLFILGDFFDYWVGDDILTEVSIEISKVISNLVDKGINVYFQHGNRDFALSTKYAELSKMKLLPEIYQIPFIPSIILLHGDQLCLSDVKYQYYRRFIRHPLVLNFLRLLPKNFRIKLGSKIRSSSQRKNHNESFDYKKNINVDENTVNDLLSKYEASIMIHGHTHQPNIYKYLNDTKTRWVLSDWENTGDYLRWDKKSGLTRYTFTINNFNEYNVLSD